MRVLVFFKLQSIIKKIKNMNFKLNHTASFLVLLLPLLAACATETHTRVEPQETRAAMSASTFTGEKLKVALGAFENKSSYMNGVFSNGGDVMGTQARTILKGHLQNSGRFSVLDRRNLDALSKESEFSGKKTSIIGASYLVTGNVVEFGRKVVGDQQLFGVLGKGKKQIAYSKVAILLVNTTTSEVVFTAQGAGEYALSEREILGFGGASGYDATLTGKVLNLAIREAVDALVDANVN